MGAHQCLRPLNIAIGQARPDRLRVPIGLLAQVLTATRHVHLRVVVTRIVRDEVATTALVDVTEASAV